MAAVIRPSGATDFVPGFDASDPPHEYEAVPKDRDIDTYRPMLETSNALLFPFTLLLDPYTRRRLLRKRIRAFVNYPELYYTQPK